VIVLAVCSFSGMSHMRERLSSNFFTAYIGATKVF
jgi:hypothetical protein